MRNPSSDRLSWNRFQLYYEGKFKIEIVPDIKYPGMFRLKWPDGVLSMDFYNLSGVKQHSKKIAMGDQEWDMEETP